MSNIVKKIVASLIAAILILPHQIYADVAPDPIERTFTILPVILVFALAVVVLFILKKSYKK